MRPRKRGEDRPRDSAKCLSALVLKRYLSSCPQNIGYIARGMDKGPYRLFLCVLANCGDGDRLSVTRTLLRAVTRAPARVILFRQ
jgi:hypothetical protein